MIHKLKKMNVLKLTCLFSAVFILIALVFTAVSYALWSSEITQETPNVASSSCYTFNFTEGSEDINLTNAYPMTETEAMSLNKYYQFTITNTCTTDMYYNITLNTSNNNYLDNSLNYKLIDENNNVIGPKILGQTTQYTEYNNKTYQDDNGTYNILNSYILTTGKLGSATMNDDHTQIIASGGSKTYKLYLWVDENVTDSSTMNKTFTGKIIVTTKSTKALIGTYKEEILNGTDPVLSSDLVPVTIETDGNGTTVKKADTSLEWYSYANKKWANAVILNKTDTYEAGDTINQSDIESYFVWIPRYKYQLWNANQADGYISGEPSTMGSDAREIKIQFENKNTQASNGSNNGEWLTHPAFTSFDVNGIWVGKYETTGDSNGLTVLPNTASFRGQTVKTFFELAKNYKTNSDSHMMKNTEWGAVAYLYHSKYGRCTNGTCEDIRINNNSNYLTGYASTDSADQSSYPGTYGTDASKTLPYYTTTGVKASTTGNITGVYDMSGGAWEYMAAYRTGTYGSSGFDASSIGNYNAKYFDVYGEVPNNSSYSYRILGDATGEMGPFYNYSSGTWTGRHNNWYADYSGFVYSSKPWLLRGGLYCDGVLAGAFSFDNDTGSANGIFGFRLVLAPQQS